MKQNPPDRVLISLSRSALTANFRTLVGLSHSQKIIAMVKADAYGHGASWVAQTLHSEKNLFGFGVATFDEGIELRKTLKKLDKIRILLFSGSTPWSDSQGNLCQKYHLTPILSNYPDARRFLKSEWSKKIPYHLKFNTGMNRLGIPTECSPEIARILRSDRSRIPEGILSHLALGELPQHPLSKIQKKAFQDLKNTFSSIAPGIHFHLANSAALWNFDAWSLAPLSTAVRPGLSLYGIEPWSGAPSKSLQPVMTVSAPVIQIQNLEKGDRVGYGGDFTAKKRTQIAILGIGYADGLHRALSNRGQVWIRNKRTSILGKISMDLCAVECPPQTQVGDRAILWGPPLSPWRQAKLAQTIPYELMTSFSTCDGTRVQRRYR